MPRLVRQMVQLEHDVEHGERHDQDQDGYDTRRLREVGCAAVSAKRRALHDRQTALARHATAMMKS